MPRRPPPARTPEERERQLISLAYDLAEDQLVKGTASAQVISNLLKLGTVQHQVELQKLKNEARLSEAKIEAMQQGKRIEELYSQAIAAMREYGGQDPTANHD